MFKFSNVAVAISGGVDSAVAALLLKLRGFNVEAVFMENWDIIDEKGQCSSDIDYADAARICEILNMKLHKVNFVKQYWNEVFCNMINDYENGLTPNPDILCNRRIKFNYLYDYAVNNLGVDALATGHYACTSFGPFLEHYNPDEVSKLLKAKDSRKDQTYFLSQVEQKALKKTMFPLGPYLKSEVKIIAKQNGLEKFANKKESMGICFIGSRNFKSFIKDYIENKTGNFIDIDSGKIVGQHDGIHQWTLGQRARISGLLKASYIARKNVENNEILLASGIDHPILFSRLCFTSKPYWVSAEPEDIKNGDTLDCDFKFQHTENWVPCTIFKCPQGLIVHLKTALKAITPGQYAVFRKDNECLGSARIVHTPITEFSLNYLSNKQNEEDEVRFQCEGC